MYYKSLHLRIDDLYNCDCEDCKNDTIINLSANYNSVDDVIKAGFEALKHLHAQGSYNYKDLDQEPYKNLINKTNSFLNKAVTDNNVTGFMKDAFKNDIFIFSHLRTHAQLQEAGSLLLTDDGKIKSFDRFKLDIAKINGLYNENYLQAEYQFAVSSVQMGEKWQNYAESNRYNLQYRTAQDDKVRISHQPLHGITLPMNNPFWDKFYPPNGWRCRCNAVQVRASKYPATNEDNALKAGDIATTQIGKDNKNRLEIFRFNSGKQQRVFPPNHPYNKVKDADKVKKEVKIEIDTTKNNYELLDSNKLFIENKERVVDIGIDKVFKELDLHESTSVYMYSMPDGYYRYLNNYNRLNKISLGAKSAGFNKETLDALTNTINTALDKIPERHKGIVYRGTELSEEHFNIYVENWKNKSLHIEKGFMSTTTDKNIAFNGNTLFEIKAKNGAKIENISAISSEKEVLFKHNQKFKIIDIVTNEKGNIIYMEEI